MKRTRKIKKSRKTRQQSSRTRFDPYMFNGEVVDDDFVKNCHKLKKINLGFMTSSSRINPVWCKEAKTSLKKSRRKSPRKLKSPGSAVGRKTTDEELKEFLHLMDINPYKAKAYLDSLGIGYHSSGF
jgi:hypothetical protein